jgi:uncharacterized protein (TIGR03067 family)
MRRRFLAALLLILPFTAILKADDAAVSGDLKKLQGTWVTPTGAEISGRWTFEGATLKAKVNEAEYTCAITLDSKATPATIDLAVKEGVGAGELSKGIYKFDGDNLVLCVTRPGDPSRPTEFKQVDDQSYLFTLMKDK